MLTIDAIREFLRDAYEHYDVAQAFDHMLTLLHDARDKAESHADLAPRGADLELTFDWIERQLQAGVDMRKGLLNILFDLDSFLWDVDDAVRHAA